MQVEVVLIPDESKKFIAQAINGTTAQINRAVDAVESVKGTRLPAFDLLQCSSCPNPQCHQRGLKDIPWLEI